MNYLTLAKYVVPVLVLLGAGGWTAHKIDQSAYAKLASEYSAFQIQVAHERQDAAEVARKAVEDQIADRTATEARNAQTIQALQNRVDTSAADLARANRLLELAAQNHPSGRAVPQTADQSGTAPAGQAPGASDLTRLLVSTKDECADNADRLDALIAEIKPQL